jgi:WhiB family transcriptional regulator, redox-sensing transcriptional regulator
MPQQPLSQVPKDAAWQWQEHARCHDSDTAIFFHPQNERGLARLRRDRSAKRICAACPVRVECADYAIRAREPYGVWGGLTEEERERIYARANGANFPRQRGEGALLAAEALDEAVSSEALGLPPAPFSTSTVRT